MAAVQDPPEDAQGAEPVDGARGVGSAACIQQLPPLEDETGFIHLDVHGALFPPYSPFAAPEEAVWSNTLPFRWTAARRLARKWAAWHLALHARVRHFRISGVRDRLHVDLLALVANATREPLDWDGVVELSRDRGTAFALAEAVGRLARAPGADALVPVGAQLAELEKAQRPRPVGSGIRHPRRGFW